MKEINPMSNGLSSDSDDSDEELDIMTVDESKCCCDLSQNSFADRHTRPFFQKRDKVSCRDKFEAFYMLYTNFYVCNLNSNLDPLYASAVIHSIAKGIHNKYLCSSS